VEVDHHALIAWIVEREEREPDVPLDGRTLIQSANSIAAESPRPWGEVARAAGKLRRLNWIEWHYMLYPGDTGEPRPDFIDQQKLQQVNDILATSEGLTAVSHRRAATAPTQVNIVNSTIGQFALRDINDVSISVILDAIECSLDELDSPDEVKEQARGAIRRMREAGASVATSAAGGVLAAAVRHSLGLS
jgi:hypothetical protein